MQNDVSTERPLDAFKIFISIIKQQRYAIILIVGVSFLTTFIALQALTDKYETEAKLLVKLGRENVEAPVTAQSGNVNTLGIRKEEINSEIEILKSQNLLERVVDNLGAKSFDQSLSRSDGTSFIKNGIRSVARIASNAGREVLQALSLLPRKDARQKALLDLKDSLTIESVRDSDVISIHYRNADREFCVRVVDSILKLYMDYHSSVRRNAPATEFFQRQMENERRRLQQAESVQNALRDKWNFHSIPEERGLLLKELTELQTQMDIHDSDRAMYTIQQTTMGERLDALQDSVNQSKTVAPNPTVQKIKDQIALLQLEKAKLSSLYAPNSQTIVNIDTQIESLSGLMNKEESTQVASLVSEANPLKREFQQNIEQLNVKIKGLDAKIRELKSPANKIAKRLNRLNEAEDQVERAKRERGLSEESYAASLRRLEAAQMSDALDRLQLANVSILSPPTKPLEPVSPRRLMIMGLALPSGLFLALGVVLLMHYLKDSINYFSPVADTKPAIAQSKPSAEFSKSHEESQKRNNPSRSSSASEPKADL
jgi:uncharacterized protein involved in exopolysaccharide biosynthesis